MANISKNTFGNRGEDVACWYLQKKGYKIRERHYTCRFGEIDIVAEDRGVVVFVEVKIRVGDSHGQPEQAVSQKKLNNLRKAIFSYIGQNFINDYRIDVLAIIYKTSSRKVVIRHHLAVSDIRRW